MDWMKLYDIGKSVDYDLGYEELEEKLRFVFFPYTANDVIFSSAIVILSGLVAGFILSFISTFLMVTAIFLSLITGIVMYIYPFNIYYTKQIMEYSEEMLKAILHLSTYIQTGSSMEYAFQKAENNIQGTLRKQFHEINTMLKRKEESTLGDAMNNYIDVWSDVNPQFVKGLRLLQIASMSPESERDRLINETVETLMVDYQTMGKRRAEKLSKNTKLLIAGGILLPILSLLVLPILAVFMPQLVRPEIVAFLYIIFFPTVVLIASLSFAANRLQVDTIRLEDHKEYEPLSDVYMYIAIACAVIFAVPSLPAIIAVLQDPSGYLDSFLYFFLVWLLGAGVALGVKTYTSFYVKKYHNLWSEINEVEEDLPFILQSFSTYYTLNTPFEQVVDGVIDDYNKLGFHDHPVVKAFRSIKKKIETSKKDIQSIVEEESKEVFPSKKVRSVISQIVSFESVSQESASKAARTVREQVINTYELDDYIKTLLSDTVSMIKMTTSMLAPLLSASAVVMTFAILKSTDFITTQIENITKAFGGGGLEIQLIDTSQVISPIFISAVIGIYLVLVTIVLSIFETQINIGNDKFRIIKNVSNNMISFLVYTVILFGGYFFVNIVLFEGILQT